jgi:hypothetical protein
MSTRRRAEEFAAVVDGVRTPADASTYVQEFFAIVERLRDVEAPTMRPEFAADLRQRLLAEAPQALGDLAGPPPDREPAAPVGHDSWRARGLRFATASVLVVATAGGVAAASQSALPGDPLYQLKRALEWVQVSTAGSDHDRGDVLLNQASERLDEAQRLAITHADDPRTAGLIADALADFEDEAQDGSTALEDDYRADGDPGSIAEIREFADESSRRLDDLAPLVPPDARDDVIDAADVLGDIDENARDACGTCSPLAPLDLSPTITQLSQEAGSILDVLPGDLGSEAGADGGQPPLNLPTLPDLTGQATGDQPSGTPSDGLPTSTGGAGDGDPSSSTGATTTAPTVPLPSVPGIPLPTVPLPSLPLPPLPTLLPLP